MRAAMIGVAWQGADGIWHILGELTANDISGLTIDTIETSPERISFRVLYAGNLNDIETVEEHYALTSGRVELTTRLPGYAGPVRWMVPLLAGDGRTRQERYRRFGRKRHR